MSDEVAEDLLAGAGVGDEELIDPRVGDDYEATIQKFSLVKNDPNVSWPYSIVATYGGMTDSEGKDFSLDDRIPLPDSETDPKIQRWFLRTLHDFGLVPRDDKRARYADDDEQRAVFLKAFQTRAGAKVPVKITERDGFVNVRLRRVKGE